MARFPEDFELYSFCFVGTLRHERLMWLLSGALLHAAAECNRISSPLIRTISGKFALPELASVRIRAFGGLRLSPFEQIRL